MKKWKWFTQLGKRWAAYRYRFVPWIMVNLKNRRCRKVKGESSDQIMQENVAVDVLQQFFDKLHEKCISGKASVSSEKIMEECLGFSISRSTSTVAGTGVFVSRGSVKRGSLLALYPGTVYQPHEPIFFQSVANSFIFRCIDGVFIDGNDAGLSKMIYRSCGQRDQVGSYFTCDFSWLTGSLRNPMAVGQYVNNETRGFPANVAYQELDIPSSFPLKYLKYMPNLNYNFKTYGSEENHVRTVMLVALRDIKQGEELFSSYFTVVY